MIRDGLTIELLIPIELLPDCYAKERLTEIAILPYELVYVVAKIGYAQDWSAYIGYPIIAGQATEYRGILTNPEGVASNGDKLGQAEAEVLFPYLKERSYRR